MKILFSLLWAASVLVFMSFKPANTPEKKMKVVIDAGHGGDDHGVEYDQLSEKEITEAISRKIKFLNFDRTVEIIVLRDKDEFMALTDRVSKINDLNPDLVISLHINSNKDTTVNGFETYIGEKNSFNDQSMEIAESISEKAPKSLAKKEVKKANFYILNNVSCPAVLIELGYLSNSQDREFLSSQLGQQRIAETIVKVVKAEK